MKFNCFSFICFRVKKRNLYRLIVDSENSEMFITKSSHQLLAIRLLMRNMFLVILRAHNFPQLNRDAIEYDIGYGKDYTYLFEAYVLSEVWKKIPSVITISRFNPNIFGRCKLDAIKYCKWANYCLMHVHYQSFAVAINAVKLVVDDISSNDITLEEGIKRIRKVYTSYSKSTFEAIKSFTNDSQNIAVHNGTSGGFLDISQAHDYNIVFDSQYQLRNELERQYRDTFRTFISRLRRGDVSELLYLFFCDSGVGSQGVYFIDNIRFPFIVPLFPPTEHFSNHLLHVIDNNAFVNLSSDMPINGMRQVQEDVENWFYHKLRTLKTTWLKEEDSDVEDSNIINDNDIDNDDNINNRDDDNNQNINNNNDEGNQNNNDDNNAGGNNNDQGDQNQQNQQQPQQDLVPDDTNYTPNSTLSRLARSYTARVINDDDDDSIHDHMTRFGVDNEGPQSVNRNDIRQGDFTIQERTWRGTTRYLVTYTRRSRKPIFNLIG